MTEPPSLLQRVTWTRGFRCQTDKDVLTALVRWFCFRPDGSNIRPSVAKLAEKSQVPIRSVERALSRLVEDPAPFLMATARPHRRPAVYCLNLDRLATEDPEHLKLAASLPARVAVKNQLDRHSGGQNAEWRSRNRPDFDEVAAQYGTEEEDLYASTSSMDRQSGGQNTPSTADPRIAEFLAWWRETYPLHNDGAQSRAADKDETIVADLLDIYPLDRLQAMSLYLWQVTSDGRHFSDRWWIAEVVTERSLRVLRHKAGYLDKASRLGAPGATQLHLDARPQIVFSDREIRDAEQWRRNVMMCPHDPPCEGFRQCVLEFAYQRRGL
jgi:hypothetical protein